MIKFLSGEKYNYQVITDRNGESCLFSFRAIDPSTGRYSSINNLNTMLDEFGVNPYDERYTDSVWVLDNSEADRFEKIAVDLLSDKTSVEYLEGELDEDRQCGEWENIEKVHH